MSEIITGDCLEYMRGLPDNSFDLILTEINPRYADVARQRLRQEVLL